MATIESEVSNLDLLPGGGSRAVITPEVTATGCGLSFGWCRPSRDYWAGFTFALQTFTLTGSLLLDSPGVGNPYHYLEAAIGIQVSAVFLDLVGNFIHGFAVSCCGRSAGQTLLEDVRRGLLSGLLLSCMTHLCLAFSRNDLYVPLMVLTCATGITGLYFVGYVAVLCGWFRCCSKAKAGPSTA